MTTAPNSYDYDRPVRLSRRSSQGVIAGFDGWNVTTMAIAGAIAIVASIRYGIPALLVTLPVWGPLFIAGSLRIHGMALPRFVSLWLMKQIRHTVGGTKTRYRPEQPQLKGTLNLPGGRASIQVWDVAEFAAIYDPLGRTVSITAGLEVEGFLMLDNAERFDLSQQWSNVLASFSQRDGITRVALQERTVPTTIEPARRFYADTVARKHLDAGTAVARNYQSVMDNSERFAVSHRNYLTLTFDLMKLKGQVRDLGGGKAGIRALAEVEAKNVGAALASAGLNVRKWLTDRELAGLVRTALDPAYLATVQSRTGDEEGVSLAAIGPMALEEPRRNNGIVRSDSGWHSTMWIHEWPRSASPVGFVEPLVFARHPVTDKAVSHIFTIVLTPVKTKAALDRIRTEKKVWRTNQRLKAKRNEHDSAEDRADWDALEAQEESLVAGNGECRYGGYLTVSATSEGDLETAMAGARNALSRTGMEAQVLYCQQAEALMVNALPIGWGMK